MKVRPCIHSDINNDDESGGVEQWLTKLPAFLFFLLFFFRCCNTFFRHTVRNDEVCVSVCVCVCVCVSASGQDTHTRRIG